MAGKWGEIHGKSDFVQVSGEFEFILWFTVLVWIQIFFIIIYYFTNSSRKKKRRVTQGSESKDSDVNKPDSKSVSEVVSGVYHFKSIFCDLYTKLIFDTSCSYYLWCTVLAGGKPRATQNWDWNSQPAEA